MKGPLICKALIARPFFIRHPTLDHQWQVLSWGFQCLVPEDECCFPEPLCWAWPDLLRGRVRFHAKAWRYTCLPLGFGHTFLSWDAPAVCGHRSKLTERRDTEVTKPFAAHRSSQHLDTPPLSLRFWYSSRKGCQAWASAGMSHSLLGGARSQQLVGMLVRISPIPGNSDATVSDVTAVRGRYSAGWGWG